MPTHRLSRTRTISSTLQKVNIQRCCGSCKSLNITDDIHHHLSYVPAHYVKRWEGYRGLGTYQIALQLSNASVMPEDSGWHPYVAGCHLAFKRLFDRAFRNGMARPLWSRVSMMKVKQ